MSVVLAEVEAALAKSPVGNTGDLSRNGTFHRLQGGLDQIEIRLDLAGTSVPSALERWDERPASKGRVRLGRNAEFGKWEPMLGRSVLWHKDRGTLWIDVHPFTDARLLPLQLVYGEVQAVLEKFSIVGVGTYEPVCVTRADVTVDVVTADGALGKSLMLALAAARGPHGRRARPFNHDLETVYIETRGGRRLGLAYDKGVERSYRALGANKWLRLEARQFFKGADAPKLEEVTPDVLKGVWQDRFLTLGGGRTVKPEGVVMTIGEMLQSGAISVRDGEKVLSYLQLERAGLAQDVYGRKALQERRLLARQYGLRVDEEGREIHLDLKAVLEEFSGAL
jgi:hypothetical protein